MTENKPGPARVVEEPAGYDHPDTERIPVPGDLSVDRTRPERLDDEPVAATPLPEPVESVTEPNDPVTEPNEPVTGFDEHPDSPNGTRTTSLATDGLFDEGAVTRLRDRWRDLQSDFVDDPARAVRGADELVDEIMRELAERRQTLAEQWRDRADDTEELRTVIREYRAFFNQLLNA